MHCIAKIEFRSRIEQLARKSTGNRIESIDISCALLLLKTRHRLSKRCVEVICSLLRVLKVPNVPNSWYQLKQKFQVQSASSVSPKASAVCPFCNGASSDDRTCSNCHTSFVSINGISPSIFYNFSVTEQVARILLTCPDLRFPNRNRRNSMKDIVDGDVYQMLLDNEPNHFITLTLNVDGIQPNKGSDKSIWPVLLVCNEINRKKRFFSENLIVAGIWPAPSKPSRNDMSIFFENIVQEMEVLENGVKFQLFSVDNEPTYAHVKVFLIASCCDKPAQALIQNIPEPNAAFGCGRCEIEGSF